MYKILFSFLFFFLQACTQVPHEDPSPMLWEISGKHLTTPSYLFGTFHTRDPDINMLSPSVYTALKSSQRLYTEIPMTEKSNQSIIRFTLLPKKVPLEDRLDTKGLKALKYFLEKIHSTLTIESLAPYKTWAIALILSNQEDQTQKSNVLFMDEYLVSMAKKYHILQSGLESPHEQLQYFDELKPEEQTLFLSDMLNQSKDETYKNALVKWYKRGNAYGFIDLQEQFKSSDTKQQQLDIKLLHGLLYTRNIRFQDRIDTLLQNNPNRTHFFAIGAGHLADERGLVKTLENLGYRLKHLN